MKTVIRLSILLLAVACNDGDPNNPVKQDSEEAFPTEVGVPIGSAIIKEIGETGGTLSSEDGMLDIEVPPGALTATTTFGIIPIVNYCPGGKNGYQLLPEDVTFTTPVTLVFHYNDETIAGTLPELLGIAYQGNDNIWYTMPGAVVDSAAQTISVEVKHFTNWTAIEYMGIYPKIPALPVLRVRQSIDLSVYGQGMSTEDDVLPPLPGSPDNNPSPQEDELPPLPKPRPFKAKWFVNGVEGGNDRVGRISPGDPVSHSYRYTAPAKTPIDDIVLVTAEITGLRKWTIEGKVRKVKSYNKVLLFKRIKILKDEYNYTLRIEYLFDEACGIPGQKYHDVVEMDVQVKDEEVSVFNIENQEPSVSPLTINLSESGCELTCDPGLIGMINVTSATGQVIPAANEGEDWRFQLELLHTETLKGGYSEVECPDDAPTRTYTPVSDHSAHLEFILSDTLQSTGTSLGNGYGSFYTLTPKK